MRNINYAELNDDNICIGLKSVSGEISDSRHIQIETLDANTYLWLKYENGEWSQEKFEPQSTAPLTEFDQLKKDNVQLKERLTQSEADNLTTLEALAEVYELLLAMQS